MNQTQKKIAEIIRKGIDTFKRIEDNRSLIVLNGIAKELADYFEEEDETEAIEIHKEFLTEGGKGFEMNDFRKFNRKQFLETAGVEE